MLLLAIHCLGTCQIERDGSECSLHWKITNAQAISYFAVNITTSSEI